MNTLQTVKDIVKLEIPNEEIINKIKELDIPISDINIRNLMKMENKEFYTHFKLERKGGFYQSLSTLSLLQLTDKELEELFIKYINSFAKYVDEEEDNFTINSINTNTRFYNGNGDYAYFKLYSTSNNIDFCDIDISKYSFASRNVYSLWLNIYHFLLENTSITIKQSAFQKKILHTRYIVSLTETSKRTNIRTVPSEEQKIPYSIIDIKELREQLEDWLIFTFGGDYLEDIIDEAFKKYISRLFTSDVLYVKELYDDIHF
jgi:hypothetical protein